jgi:hypothetical protein
MSAAIVSTVAAGAIAVTGATAARAGDVPPPPVGTAGLAGPVGAPGCSTSENGGTGAPAIAGVEATTRPAADPG